jgi:cytochrome c biogenesis protein
MPFASTFPDATDVSVGSIEAVLHRRGWKTQHAETDKDRVIAGQKGAWTRTGVYIVHTSILIIFAGAIVGHFLGFKGNVMIPETKKTAGIFTSETQAPFDLGFEVRCDMFEIEFYDNGMPKEYRSKLTVIENDVEVLTKEIEVNSPLKYKGITFYQSSYEGYRDFLVTLTDAENGISRTFVVPFQQQVEWPEKNIVFGIVNAEAIKDRVVRMKVWFKSADQPPVVLWLDSLAESPADKAYTIKVKQMYATGLQVAKDPGVWLVYLGCGLMMLGLFIAFFMSHQRVWVILMKDHSKRSLLLVGTTNKNKIGFEKIFSDLTADVRETCDKKTA